MSSSTQNNLWLLFLLSLMACSPSEDKIYKAAIQNLRLERNEEFISSSQSPLNDSLKNYFVGLKYFEINKDYKVEATLKLLTEPKEVELQTRGERRANYLLFAHATFLLNGSEQQLSVFKEKSAMGNISFDNQVFIPFYDETNGSLTYTGGRYLYANLKENQMLELDFNLATNPYCAYNSKYVCVLPPEENTLSIEIKAGEKLYH